MLEIGVEMLKLLAWDPHRLFHDRWQPIGVLHLVLQAHPVGLVKAVRLEKATVGRSRLTIIGDRLLLPASICLRIGPCKIV
jgi:hypothetical protein